MASYFYLYLYTDDSHGQTEYITVTVSKSSRIIQKGKNMTGNNFEMYEGTSYWIDVTVKNEDGTNMNLTGCTAVFTSGSIEKACLINANSINVKIEPANTVGKLSMPYQIRVFDSLGDVFQIIQGYIYIRKAHKPYTQNPLSTGGEG